MLYLDILRVGGSFLNVVLNPSIQSPKEEKGPWIENQNEGGEL